jgi:hypothetical protein
MLVGRWPNGTGVDRAVIALLKWKPTPGIGIKPIQPDKY